MPVWAWILIGIGAAVVVATVAWALAARRRSMQLQQHFGSEYNRVASRSSNRREAEAELAGRERRRERFQLRPLTANARERYAERWRRIQADFVDSPGTAVTEGDALVSEVMRDRGYPMDDFDQRSADISVDHPDVVENYREGHRLSLLSARGEASTEDLRQALRHYRKLFDELVEASADEPTSAERREIGTREQDFAEPHMERTRR